MRNGLLTLAEVINNTISTLDEIQTNLSSLAQVVMDNCIALYFLLVMPLLTLFAVLKYIALREKFVGFLRLSLMAHGICLFGLSWANGVPGSEVSCRDY